MALPEKRKRGHEAAPKQVGDKQPKSILKKQKKSVSTSGKLVQREPSVDEDPVDASEDEDRGGSAGKGSGKLITDEFALDEVDNVEEPERADSDDEEDDFQDVKSKSILPPESFALTVRT